MTVALYEIRAEILPSRSAPATTQLEAALDVGIKGAPEDTGLDAISTFEVVDATNEREQRAALIAAAPELLDKLEQFEEAWGADVDGDNSIQGTDAVDFIVAYLAEVRALIAKAKGSS